MVTFIETPGFTRLITEYVSDDDYARLQAKLAASPESGSVLPGSGGVRKLRWALPGGGKRGGLRVIYYVRLRKGVIWMLTVYPKNVRENIPSHVLKRIREEIENA